MPKRTVIGRGRRAALMDWAAGRPGDVVLVRSRSAAWADTAARHLQAMGRTVHLVEARGEPTLPAVTDVRDSLRGQEIAMVVAIGGGSAMDLGKALAALLPSDRQVLDHLEVVGKGLPLDRDPLPFAALPTTAGTGAEATKNAVIDIPNHARKVSLRDPRMVPQLAILDADLTYGLPWPVTAMTGMDAVTQLIEPFLSRNATPATDQICRAAIGPAMRALLRLSRSEDPKARHVLLVAAHLSGIALANAGLGAVHGLAGVVGGRTGAPHGAICARLLPGVLQANREACRQAGLGTDRFDEVDAMIARAFDAPGQSAADLIGSFVTDLDLPSLRGPDASRFDADEIAADAAGSSSMKANRIDLPTDVLVRVLQSAE
ncbi:iron-containing alcohol dehydrogenase [Anianabacter salinae]|uniref:iron-containing alcohol dehydrogenase n=1 Tax=Anianabacter salinae TaxID=2851023 RepID=UPI00225E3AF9|nr:iron-containing alcohol dehydrogenase [Anianabacter salinae]